MLKNSKKLMGVLSIGALMTTGVNAAVIDNMDNADMFSAAFGAASAADNGSGQVVFSKSAGASTDSGITWSDLGGAKISLTDSLVTITAHEPADNDYININAIYFDAAGDYVGQSLVLPDTNAETPINFDVAIGTLPANAASYVLQIRILPWAAAEASYTFDQISAQAVPEPASMLLLGAGGLLMLRRRSS
ncbi:hypothetical protein KS4_30690 [Poriferisphaera corsica]|uniref:Ice-binding protein C-terminal domain-containing protein n=1 Tax=Poriferisphaera corsica TaxID=2528020 RepID=A0A517YXN1_9BACT|nr:PEP-CTERM sorting domain-containing protein [Poriferisphaera corsica]QDU34992.1 hypothetical protein KS4_30690 [Poriferisphaera corsica]